MYQIVVHYLPKQSVLSDRVLNQVRTKGYRSDLPRKLSNWYNISTTLQSGLDAAPCHVGGHLGLRRGRFLTRFYQKHSNTRLPRPARWAGTADPGMGLRGFVAWPSGVIIDRCLMRFFLFGKCFACFFEAHFNFFAFFL